MPLDKIVVIGGTGLLGSVLVPRIRELFRVAVMGRDSRSDVKVNVGDTNDLNLALDKVRPEVVVNLAALADIEYCEFNPSEAFKVHIGVNACIRGYLDRNPDSYALGISTDHVYDSPNSSVESEVNLKNIYAASKFLGESILLRGARAASIRTNFVGSSPHPLRRSFSDVIVSSKNRLDSLTLFEDVYFSPVSLNYLSETICKILMKYRVEGCFNLGSSSQISKFYFGRSLLEGLGVNTRQLRPYKFSEVQGKKCLVSRPLGMGMNSEKLFSHTGLTPQTYEQVIESIIRGYR